jgi:hypothetical protein
MDRRAEYPQTDSEFYLYFNEGFHEEQPRHCTRIKRVSFGSSSEITGLLVRVTPPCAGKQYGVEHEQVDSLLISPLFAGQSLFPVEKWPMHVHIYLPLLESPELRDRIDVAETKNIAIGEIRKTLDERR